MLFVFTTVLSTLHLHLFIRNFQDYFRFLYRITDEYALSIVNYSYVNRFCGSNMIGNPKNSIVAFADVRQKRQQGNFIHIYIFYFFYFLPFSLQNILSFMSYKLKSTTNLLHSRPRTSCLLYGNLESFLIAMTRIARQRIITTIICKQDGDNRSVRVDFQSFL